jgi:hypothetical protein
MKRTMHIGRTARLVLKPKTAGRKREGGWQNEDRKSIRTLNYEERILYGTHEKVGAC